MVSVWLTIPSARPIEEVEPVLQQWVSRGYSVALWRDWGAPSINWDALGLKPNSRMELKSNVPYPGYAAVVNLLIAQVAAQDPGMQWCIAAGDDTLPDPNHSAEEIAQECRYHFEDLAGGNAHRETFGVMQPTGDRFAEGSIDRIAGSPWIGRQFAARMYGGKGPYWPEYRHMFVDEELMEVAQLMGVFWQRPDLIHLHRHFQRESDALDSVAVAKPIPAHLVEANSQAHWDKYLKLFRDRKQAGFPGHEPVA